MKQAHTAPALDGEEEQAQRTAEAGAGGKEVTGKGGGKGRRSCLFSLRCQELL